MKTNEEVNNIKMPLVIIDPKLNELNGQVLFPEKVEKAKQAFEKLGLPDLKKGKG